MKSQLYVPEHTRRYFQSQISSFVEIYSQKLLPVFQDMEKEADKCAHDFYDDYMNQPSYDDSVDPASIAEEARDIGIERYCFLKLGRYHVTAAWHAMLYEFWEQQIRSFLFREISKDKPTGGFKKFCDKLEKIKTQLELHNVDIENCLCWHKIDELRLLCNVIKHSDGTSLDCLRKKKSGLLKKGSVVEVEVIDLYRTSLLEETLNIDETTLQDYKDALLSFWERIPERSYSTE
jgi:hypothetical protein